MDELLKHNLQNKFLRNNLDILFISLKISEESYINGHYFSSTKARFFKLMYKGGLTVKDISDYKNGRYDENFGKIVYADELVFGNTIYNYKNKTFGIIDVVPHHVGSAPKKVKVNKNDFNEMICKIRTYKPKNVCIIHSEIKDAFQKYLNKELKLGFNGKVLCDEDINFFYNYFPNGNNKPDNIKTEIFREMLKYL